MVMPDLYDANGNLIPAAALKKPPVDPARVATIRDRFSNYPTAGLTPGGLAGILDEMDLGEMRRAMELFEEMEEKDNHLASLLQTRKLSLVAKGWEIVPPKGDDSPRTREICAAATAMIESIPNWTGAIMDLLDALLKGVSLLQIHWRVAGGSVSIGRLEWIHPKFITYANSMQARLVTDAEPMGIELPPFKFVLHRHRSRAGFDVRLGLGRAVAWLYLLVNYAVKDWAGFCETFGTPARIGTYPAGASEDDKNALVSALAAMGADYAAAISESMKIDLIESGSAAGTADLFDRFISRMEKRMTLAVLGQLLTSEAGGASGSGSRALGEVHGGILDNLIESDGRALDDTITDQLLRPWVIFNYGADAPVPRYHSMVEPAEDKAALVELYDKAINQLGMDVSQEHLSETLKIPLRQPGETAVIRAASNPLSGFNGFGAAPASDIGGGSAAPRTPAVMKDLAGGAALADAGAPALPETLVDDPTVTKMEATKQALMDWTSRNVGPALNAHLAPLRKLIAGTKSLEELQAALSSMKLDQDNLGTAQAQSFALAKLAGRSDVQRVKK
jgi:phage gp29-like protein